MAEGRFINQSVAVDERLNGMSQGAMLLYLMTVPHLDRDGLIDGRPRVLWAKVSPLQDAWITTVDGLIDEWVGAGLVVRYMDGSGKVVLYFAGFAKNQKGMVYQRERPSRYDCPPGMMRTERGLQVIEDCSALHEQIGGLHDLLMQSAGAGQTQSNGVVHDAREEIGSGRAHVDGYPHDAREEISRVHEQVMPEVKDQHEVEVPSSGGGGSSSPPPLGFGKGGVQRGDDETGASWANAFDEGQMRAAAWRMAGELCGSGDATLQETWTGLDGWLTKAGPGTLAIFIEWMQWYGEQPWQVRERIENMAGMIRAKLNRGQRASLTWAMQQDLPRVVRVACGMERDPWERRLMEVGSEENDEEQAEGESIGESIPGGAGSASDGVDEEEEPLRNGIA